MMEKLYKFIGFQKVKKPFYLVSSLLILLAGTLGFIYSAKAYSQLFYNDYVVEKNPIVSPKDDIAVNFTQPILLTDKTDIRIYPEQEVNLKWENGNKKLVISPRDSWKMETEYAITLPAMKSIMFTVAPEKEITFKTMDYPKVAEFLPGENAENVSLDIEDPLAVQFSNEMKDFDVKFMVDNAEAVSLASDENKSAFGFLPKNVEDGRQYLAQVLIKPKGASESSFKGIYSASFKTSAPAAKKTETDFTQRLADARKNTTAKIKEGKYIDLNIATQVLSTFENGKLLDSYIVSSGKKGMDTPKGQFKVMAKKLRPWSSKYKLYMPFFMQFTGQGHGIHELPEWPGGYKEGANHLGIPVSHGCVRLGVGPAQQVYGWAEAGTPIVIY